MSRNVASLLSESRNICTRTIYSRLNLIIIGIVCAASADPTSLVTTVLRTTILFEGPVLSLKHYYYRLLRKRGDDQS